MFDFLPADWAVVAGADYARMMLGMSLLWAVMYVSMRVWISWCVAACLRHTRLQRMPLSRRTQVVQRMVSRALERSWMLIIWALFHITQGMMLGLNTCYVAVASPVTRLIWEVTWLCGVVMH